MKMICTQCGRCFDFDPDAERRVCPYCRSTHLINRSKPVDVVMPEPEPMRVEGFIEEEDKDAKPQVVDIIEDTEPEDKPVVKRSSRKKD